MSRRAAVVLAIGVMVASHPGSARDVEGPSVRIRTVTGRFSRDQLARKALQVLGAKRITVGALRVYANASDEYRLTRGWTDCDYCGWRSFIEYQGLLDPARPCIPLAMAQKLGTSIELRTVDSACRVERLALAGPPGQAVDISGTTVEILWLEGRIRPRKGAHRPRFSAFARTDSPVTENLARATLEWLRKTAAVSEVSVELRNDSWFPADCDFPAWYPFSPRPAAVPSLDALLATSQAHCGVLYDWPVRCSSISKGSTHRPCSTTPAPPR